MPDRTLAEKIVADGSLSLQAAGDSFQTAALLEEVSALIRRYVVVSPKQLDVLAPYVLHTHAIAAAEWTPFLAVTSPEKGSGKTLLLEVLELLVREPIRAVSASEAALFRSIEKFLPTLLLDEVDAIFGGKAQEYETLRGILNAGNRRGASVLRMIGEGKGMDVKKFPVFCPRVLAGIGRLPDTIADRSIPIRMKKKTRSETVDRFRGREASVSAQDLKKRVAEWGSSAMPLLQSARPELPDELSSRAADGAEPLLAIADLAGQDWARRTRSAIVELCSAGAVVEDETEGVRLLHDCRLAFDAETVDRLSSEDLCRVLGGLEESPWSGLSKRGLAEKLRPYGIRSKQMRPSNAKGYFRAAFEEPWERYLPPPSPETGGETKQAKQPNNGGPPELFPDAKHEMPEAKHPKPVSLVSFPASDVSREPGDESSIDTGFVSNVSSGGPFREGGEGEDEEAGF